MAAYPQCHGLELTRWFRGGANWLVPILSRFLRKGGFDSIRRYTSVCRSIPHPRRDTYQDTAKPMLLGMGERSE